MSKAVVLPQLHNTYIHGWLTAVYMYTTVNQPSLQYSSRVLKCMFGKFC